MQQAVKVIRNYLGIATRRQLQKKRKQLHFSRSEFNLKIGKKTLLEKKVPFNATITQTYIEPVVNSIFQTTYFWFPHSKNNLYSFFTFLTPKIGAFFTSRIFLNIVIDNLKLKTDKAFAVRKGRNQKISNVTFSVMVVVYQRSTAIVCVTHALQ